jgi:tRNA(fMet)-specific endonuclease VapC
VRFLLDTNMVIAWLVRADLRVAQRLAEQRADVALSAVVSHELYFGAFNSDRVEENMARLQTIGIPILPFEDGDAREAGRIRAMLKRRGTPIGPYDLLIAGQALARGLTVVTANSSEFARVDGLRHENWLND